MHGRGGVALLFLAYVWLHNYHRNLNSYRRIKVSGSAENRQRENNVTFTESHREDGEIIDYVISSALALGGSRTTRVRFPGLLWFWSKFKLLPHRSLASAVNGHNRTLVDMHTRILDTPIWKYIRTTE